MSTNPSSTQKFSRNKLSLAGHISPPRFELSNPRFIRKKCVGKNPQDHFLSAKTKKRCQLKCYKLKVCCLQTDLMFIFCTSIWPLRENFLVAIWLVPVSLGQPCFVLVWSGLIRSQEKCIQKWISAAMFMFTLYNFWGTNKDCCCCCCCCCSSDFLGNFVLLLHNCCVLCNLIN